ncbi:MAG: hypothetical protein AAF281_06170 [Pseudomonadota bacterium]
MTGIFRDAGLGPIGAWTAAPLLEVRDGRLKEAVSILDGVTDGPEAAAAVAVAPVVRAAVELRLGFDPVAPREAASPTVSLREYTWMALDATDTRTDPFGINVPEVIGPDFAGVFGPAGWQQVPGGVIGTIRNSTISTINGFDADINVNAVTGQTVLAIRSTELGAALDGAGLSGANRATATALQDGLAAAAVNPEQVLTADVLTLFGYYQDGGDSLVASLRDIDDLTDFLTDNAGLNFFEALALAGAISGLSFALEDAIRDIAVLGEAILVGQATDAIRAAIETAAAFDNDTFSVTGHSLGGGLTAYLTAALGIEGTAFDPAPYANIPFLEELRTTAETILAVEYPELDAETLGFDFSAPAAQALADGLDIYRLDGSFVEDLYRDLDPALLPEGAGSDTIIDLNAPGAIGFSLHSMELHALVIDSALREDRVDVEDLADALPSLVRLLTDGTLLGRETLVADDFSPVLRALLTDDALYAEFETGLADVIDAGLSGRAEEALVADVLTDIADTAAERYGTPSPFFDGPDLFDLA